MANSASDAGNSKKDIRVKLIERGIISQMADDVYDSIRILLMKNKKLAEQRDMLLPRLMRGKLEV